jgi:GTPase KRas protein
MDEYDPTIEDSYRKSCVIDGEVAFLDILDTSGLEIFSAMREQWMRIGAGFIIVYSITDRESFEEVEVFTDQILRIKNKKTFPMILVGNKLDREHERVVSKEEGLNLAAKLGCPFKELSAKSEIDVHQMFYAVVREIRTSNKLVATYSQQKKEDACILM